MMNNYRTRSQARCDSSNNDCDDDDGDTISSTPAGPSPKKIYDSYYQEILSSKINAAAASSSGKKTRLPYSYKEDLSIIKYIVKNNYIFDTSGTMMWKKMELDNVCRIRTWQSMKERFIKHIKYDVIENHKEKYPFITPKVMKLLLHGLMLKKQKTNCTQASS